MKEVGKQSRWGEIRIPIRLRESGLVQQKTLSDQLDLGNVCGLQTLRAAFNFELHLIAFVQVSVTFTSDRLVVNEHIFTTRAGDKSETFGAIEPLHCALFHGTDPFFYTNPQPGGHGTYIEVVCFKQKIAATALSFTIVAISILLRVCTKEL
jgi:hypothetical protein